MAEDDLLSWSDLNAQGAAFSNEDIWEEVDFAVDSSDEDLLSISSGASSSRVLPGTPGGPVQDYVVPDDVFVSGEDEKLISSVKKSQFWRSENHSPVLRGKEEASRLITELQFARETIFMLQGLPTSIFWRLDHDIEVDRSYALAHSSNEALASLLRSFTEIGANVNTLRHFTTVPQIIPYMQTFCRGIEERLLDFDGALSQIQCQYLSAGSTVSLLHLLDDVRQRSRHLVMLAELISKLGSASIDRPMRCLDLLYDLICMLEALGDESASSDLAALFSACFKTYTRSIQLWMEFGQLDSKDSAFFVRVNRVNGDLRTLWHDWYVLDEGRARQNIPRFLEPSAQKVFITGKSMVFLRHLRALPDRSENSAAVWSDAIFDDIAFTQSSSLSLPFSALVETVFDRLVHANHSISAGLLRAELNEQCGLWISLHALQHIYLGKDLSILWTIDSKVFELMDRGRSWDDKFMLTELARSAFSMTSIVEPKRLVMRSSTSSHDPQSRTVKVLESLSIEYVLPWSVANIITEDAIRQYQRIFIFLMQIRRAKYAIMRQRLRDGRKMSTEDSDHTLVPVLHHTLLWFLDLLYSHLTYTVITTANQSLRLTLSNAEDVDGMIAAHQSYMTSLEDECLVSENLTPIHEAIIHLLDLCIHFADLQAARASENEVLEHSSDGRVVTSSRRTVDDASDSDSDDEDADADIHEHTLTISFHESSYTHRMRNVKRQSDHLINFIADGLKGVARAGESPSWNILADKLEWRKGWHRT